MADRLQNGARRRYPTRPPATAILSLPILLPFLWPRPGSLQCLLWPLPSVSPVSAACASSIISRWRDRPASRRRGATRACPRSIRKVHGAFAWNRVVSCAWSVSSRWGKPTVGRFFKVFPDRNTHRLKLSSTFQPSAPPRSSIFAGGLPTHLSRIRTGLRQAPSSRGL